MVSAQRLLFPFGTIVDRDASDERRCILVSSDPAAFPAHQGFEIREVLWGLEGGSTRVPVQVRRRVLSSPRLKNGRVSHLVSSTFQLTLWQDRGDS